MEHKAVGMESSHEKAERLFDTSKTVETGDSGTPEQRTLDRATDVSSVKKRLSEMPKSFRNNYLAAVNEKASPRGAIKAHCCECCGYDRSEVRNCTSVACPLYLYRPFQNGPEVEE